MKKCLSCNINIGGDRRQCPICQGPISGEASPNYWPEMRKLRLQSLFYKIQLFLVLTAAIISMALDFLLDIRTDRHWSVPIAATAVVIELFIRHVLKKSIVIAAIVTDSAIVAVLLLIFSGWYMGFLNPIVVYLVPIVISVLLIANLVFSFIDKRGNAIVYLLANIIMGVTPYVCLYIIHKDIPLTWTICLMLSVITFTAICVFRGRTVTTEIQKRMNL